MNAAFLTRRRFLERAAFLASGLSAPPSWAGSEADAAIAEIIKGAPISRGRVFLTMPAIADNGFSVFTTVSVASPMTENDYVKSIHLISEKNPIPVIARFFFTAAMAQAKVATNIRLAASQKVTALAVMSDGSVWSDEKNIVVSIAACIDGG